MKDSIKSKKLSASKLIGVLVAMAVLGLSLGDALTGHGIKGNKNLNPIVVGDGSGSGNGSGNGGASADCPNGGCGLKTCPWCGSDYDFPGWKSGECHTLIGYGEIEDLMWDPVLKELVIVVTATITVKTCQPMYGVECEEGFEYEFVNTGEKEGPGFTPFNCAAR